MIAPETVILHAAAIFAFLVGGAAVLRNRSEISSWCLLIGMITLGADGVLGGLGMLAVDPGERDDWLTAQIIAKSLLPGVWLCFSLTYCRGDASGFLKRWKWLLGLAFFVPPAVAIAFRTDLVVMVAGDDVGGEGVPVFGQPVWLLTVLLLLSTALILVNLEKTYRAAVGTVRWRVKFLFIGIGLVFGVRIYTLSQAMLFSRFDGSMTTVDGVALLLGCVLMTVAYARRGFGGLALYPSRTVLQGSLAIVLIGAYLVAVGIFAQVASALGAPEGFPAKAFVILVGTVGLAVALASDRFRTTLQRQIVRHFSRPQHDSQAIWTEFTRRSFGVMDRGSLSRAASEVIAREFHVLTIRILLLDPDGDTLTLVASTFDGEAADSEESPSVPAPLAMREGIEKIERTFDLERLRDDWLEPLREACPSQFPNGGNRLGVPLFAAERLQGVMVLADRVNGISYTQEERDLLYCLGDQLAAGLLNLNLSAKQMESKELEAFQTMSTFFVHDLKNAAHSLGLMLQNLPNHFDDPEFREDALRGLGSAADRINNMIARLSTLGRGLQPELAECDFNELVNDTLDGLGDGFAVVRDLQAVPQIWIDHNQIQSVLTNLVINATEASGENGEVRVETRRTNGHLVVEVRDDGSGMSREFVRDSLFKPFVSTKSKGLGIGMFQSKMIVEAHRGTIEVLSEPEKGTRIRIALPVD